MENFGNENKNGLGKKRRSVWSKLLDLIFRVCHIGMSGVLFGGIFWKVPFTKLLVWHHLAIGSGSALIVTGVLQSRHWPYQGRGLMAAVHIGLFWLIHIHQEFMFPVLTTALTFGVIGSHMPGHLRHWSLAHGRRID